MPKVQTAEQATGLMTLDPQALIKAAIETGADIEKMRALFDLAKDVQAERARQAWFSAFAQFQAECPAPKKDQVANMGTFKFSYATLEEWMETIRPVAGRLGLSISWEGEQQGQVYVSECLVSHEMGHTVKSGKIAVPVPPPLADGKGANPMQRVGIAQSYAMRYALRGVIGLAPEDDDDNVVQTTATTVRQPQRTSQAEAPAPAAASGEVQTWVGSIAETKVKRGTTNGKPWTLYVLVADDNTEFGTFDLKHYEFAKEAGTSPVVIEWVKTAKGGRNVVSIAPAESEMWYRLEQVPHDEVPGA